MRLNIHLVFLKLLSKDSLAINKKLLIKEVAFYLRDKDQSSIWI